MKTEKILKGAICAIGAVAISSFLAYHESKTQNAEQKMSKNSVADSEKITAGVVEEKLNLVKEWDKVFEKFREYELTFGEELNIWCKNHYMWGLNDMAKLKSEIQFITSKNFTMQSHSTSFIYCGSRTNNVYNHPS